MGFSHVQSDVRFDVMLFCCSFALWWLLNKLMIATNYFKNDKNGRYFSIHVLHNLAITIVHLPDLYHTYLRPADAIAGPSNSFGAVIIGSLHLFHVVVFFEHLQPVDWVHHIVSCVFTLPLAYGLQPGYLMGHGVWFGSGLPGGLDYVMLILVKTKRMESLTEKKWNTFIQTWIRNPGCLFHALLTWASLQGPHFQEVAARSFLPLWLVMPAHLSVVTFLWNGPYFASRVAVNYGMAVQRAKDEKAKKDSAARGNKGEPRKSPAFKGDAC